MIPAAFSDSTTSRTATSTHEIVLAEISSPKIRKEVSASIRMRA
jgi:hypothetical protein